MKDERVKNLPLHVRRADQGSDDSEEPGQLGETQFDRQKDSDEEGSDELGDSDDGSHRAPGRTTPQQVLQHGRDCCVRVGGGGGEKKKRAKEETTFEKGF